MNTHFLNSHTFYILSGPSASGKSFLTNQLIAQGLPNDAIISSDQMRKQILGSKYELDDNGIRENLYGWSYNQPEIFNLIDQMLTIRFKQKLPTIFDATNLTDSDRGHLVKLALDNGVNSHVIIINTDPSLLKERIKNRAERFDFSVIEKQLEIFQLTSKYPHTVVTSDDKFIFNPLLLDTSNLVIVGDTHGMLTPLVEMLHEQGFNIINNAFKHSEKKIVFLGDVLDRGEDCIDLLKLVKNTVTNQDGYFLLGNHENKLIQSYQQYLKDGTVKGKSISSSQTLIKFLSLPENERQDIYQFLVHSPVSLNLWVNKDNLKAIVNEKESPDFIKFGMIHAHSNYYHPYKIPKSEAVYGSSRNPQDIDLVYEQNYEAKVNSYILLRGHVKESSKQSHVFSLEDDQAFDGHLMTLDMTIFLNNLKNNKFVSNYSIFESAIMKKKTNYNFNNSIKDTVELMKGLQALQKEGLVTDGVRKNPETGQKVFPPDGLKIYKYAKKVHFKRLWKTNPLLEKARGLVLDDSGNIVVHPFDKIYNFEEYDTGKEVKAEQKVYCIEKLNGFLGCISKHPFKNELLVSTTGSLASDYVDYIKDFIDEKVKSELLYYFSKNNKTLMFEVLHPKDTENHIVPYKHEELGLWLIGARERKLSSPPDTEKQLDALGKTLNFRRPSWEILPFAQVLNKVRNSELEGYMVRDSETNKTLMKIKTNYYLVTKFVGRMAPKKVEMMFKAPEKFKELNMEEEFYSLVDAIVKNTDETSFNAMLHPERVSFVRDLVIQARKPETIKKISP